VNYDRVFSNASSLSLNILFEAEEKVQFFKNNQNQLYCPKGYLMHENTVFGQTVLAVAGCFGFRNGRHEERRNDVFNYA
jgi:hypothetical protein